MRKCGVVKQINKHLSFRNEAASDVWVHKAFNCHRPVVEGNQLINVQLRLLDLLLSPLLLLWIFKRSEIKAPIIEKAEAECLAALALFKFF